MPRRLAPEWSRMEVMGSTESLWTDLCPTQWSPLASPWAMTPRPGGGTDPVSRAREEGRSWAKGARSRPGHGGKGGGGRRRWDAGSSAPWRVSDRGRCRWRVGGGGRAGCGSRSGSGGGGGGCLWGRGRGEVEGRSRVGGGDERDFIETHLRLREDAHQLKAAGDKQELDDGGVGDLGREGEPAA